MNADPRIAALAEALHKRRVGCRTDYRGDFDCMGGPGYHEDDAAAILAALPPDLCGHGAVDLDNLGYKQGRRHLEEEIARLRDELRGLVCEHTVPKDWTLVHNARLADLRAIEEAARDAEPVMRQYASLFGGGIGRDERTVLAVLDALRAALAATEEE